MEICILSYMFFCCHKLIRRRITMDTIHPDVVPQICKDLNQVDIAQCLCVCKSWNAIPHLRNLLRELRYWIDQRCSTIMIHEKSLGHPLFPIFALSNTVAVCISILMNGRTIAEYIKQHAIAVKHGDIIITYWLHDGRRCINGYYFCDCNGRFAYMFRASATRTMTIQDRNLGKFPAQYWQDVISIVDASSFDSHIYVPEHAIQCRDYIDIFHDSNLGGMYIRYTVVPVSCDERRYRVSSIPGKNFMVCDI